MAEKMQKQKFARAALRAIEDFLGVQSQENVVVFSSGVSAGLETLIYTAARHKCANACLLKAPDRAIDSKSFHDFFQSSLAHFQAAIILHPHICHLTLPEEWLVHRRGLKLLCISAQSQKTFARWMQADLLRIREQTKKVAELLTIGQILHLSSNDGCELEFDIRRQKGLPDTGAFVDESIRFLPAGEAFIRAAAKRARGRLKIDFLAGMAPESTPTELLIRDGLIRQVKGESKTAAALRKFFRLHGQTARQILGIGIGLNASACFGKSAFEDRKVRGGVNVTIGDPGWAPLSNGRPHVSGIFLQPTLSINSRVLLRKGSFEFL